MQNPTHASPTRLVWALLASAGLGGCGALDDTSPRNLGRTEDVSATVGPEAFTTDPSTFFGRWSGHAEDALALEASADGAARVYRFPSGSSEIALEITPLGDSG